MSLAELGQEYAAIILRQETGLDVWGDEEERYQEGDRERKAFIEQEFKKAGDCTLEQYVDNWVEVQKESLE